MKTADGYSLPDMQVRASSFARSPSATLGGRQLQVRNAGEHSRLGSYQDLAITIKDVPAPPLVLTRMELLEGSTGIITKLENKVAGLPDYEAQLRQTIQEKNAVLADVEKQPGKPFKYEDKLTQARAKCAALDERLKASIEPGQQQEAITTDGTDPIMEKHRRLLAASFPSRPSTTGPSVGPGHTRSTRPLRDRSPGWER